MYVTLGVSALVEVSRSTCQGSQAEAQWGVAVRRTSGSSNANGTSTSEPVMRPLKSGSATSSPCMFKKYKMITYGINRV